MSDRELRSWSAGDPEPPEDVMQVRDSMGDVWSRTFVTAVWSTPETAWMQWSTVAKKYGPLVEVLPETPTPDPNMIYAPWDDETVAALNAFQHAGAFHPFTCGREHRTPGHALLVATTGGWVCSRRPACGYTQLWAHAFMAESVAPVSVVQDDTPATHEVDQAQVDQVNKVLADLRGEVHGLRSCVDNLKDLYNLDPGVTTEILEHVALQQQKQLTAALALVEEMSLHLRQDVALSLGVESRLAELREGVQG